jgi:hypothetical protein
VSGEVKFDKLNCNTVCARESSTEGLGGMLGPTEWITLENLIEHNPDWVNLI